MNVAPVLVPPPPDHADELGPLLEQAQAFAAGARSPRTRRAYDAQWRAFVAWCVAVRLRPLPASPDTVALYVVALQREGLSPSTIDVALAAIAAMHMVNGSTSPCAATAVREVRAGMRRTCGIAPRQAAPLRLDELRAVVSAIGAGTRGLLGLRDRALLLVG